MNGFVIMDSKPLPEAGIPWKTRKKRDFLLMKKQENELFQRLGFPKTPGVLRDYDAQNPPFFPAWSQKSKFPERLSFPGTQSPNPNFSLDLVTRRRRSLRIFPRKWSEKHRKLRFSMKTFSPGEEKLGFQLGFCLFLLLRGGEFPGISLWKVLWDPNTLQGGNCVFRASPPRKFHLKNHHKTPGFSWIHPKTHIPSAFLGSR